MSYRGKVLLQVERTDSKWVPFRISVFLQSSSPQPRGVQYALVEEVVSEELCHMETRAHPCPACMDAMREGDRLTFTARYDVHFWQDYWGEWDSRLRLERVRVIKRRPLKK